jgi:hypothetical protein
MAPNDQNKLVSKSFLEFPVRFLGPPVTWHSRTLRFVFSSYRFYLPTKDGKMQQIQKKTLSIIHLEVLEITFLLNVSQTRIS